MGDITTDPTIAELRWRTGLIGCFLPVMVCICVGIGAAAVSPSLAEEMADARRGDLIRLTRDATFGGVNVPLIIVTLYLCWEVFRLAWRWVDEIAVKATPSGLLPHRSTFVKAIAWSEIDDVSFVTIRRAPSLIVKLRDGTTQCIRGISNENGSAEKFAAYARQKAENC